MDVRTQVTELEGTRWTGRKAMSDFRQCSILLNTTTLAALSALAK